MFVVPGGRSRGSIGGVYSSALCNASRLLVVPAKSRRVANRRSPVWMSSKKVSGDELPRRHNAFASLTTAQAVEHSGHKCVVEGYAYLFKMPERGCPY
jgi:hypothetical protein